MRWQDRKRSTRLAWMWGAGLLVVLGSVILVFTCVQWGDYGGISGTEWFHFWGRLLPALLVAVTASVAATVAWRTLEQTRAEAKARRRQEHRDEFWGRLETVVQYLSSEDPVHVNIGATLATYVYENPFKEDHEGELLEEFLVMGSEQLRGEMPDRGPA